MSKGTVCRCKGPHLRKNWVIVQYKCNHSAFNGYKKTHSDYSALRCTLCGATWRTKAQYVYELIHGDFDSKPVVDPMTGDIKLNLET